MKKKEYCFRNLNTGEIDYVEVEITSSITASGQREKRQKPTPECMRRNNIRVRQKKIRHLIRANFQENDIYLTLTYKRGTRPETLGDVKKHVQRFIKKLRKQYKSRGYQLKYVGTLERGSKGGYHMHIVLNRIPDAETYMHKTWEHGHVRTQCLYQEGEFKDLGDYLGKDSSDRWQTTSRNLIKPEEHTKEVKDNGKLLESPPERRKGFEIVKDSVYSGINPLTGRAYLKYSQKKITGKQKKIDIWIQVKADPPDRVKWMYIMELTGKTWKRTGSCIDSVMGAELIAIAEAVKRIKGKRQQIRIHVGDLQLREMITYRLQLLADQQFRIDGVPIDHQEQWIAIWMSGQGRRLICDDDSRYKEIMMRRLEGVR